MVMKLFTVFILIICTKLLKTTAGFKETKTFGFSLGKDDYTEEKELEMIQPENLPQALSINENSGKYERLHSHVRYYNRRAVAKRHQKPKKLLKKLLIPEINFIEPKPYIAGFREDLKKLDKRDLSTNANYENSESTPATTELSNDPKMSADTGEIEEDYDYAEFKAEFDNQLAESQNQNRSLNYTKKLELEDSGLSMPLRKIVELKKMKNCTAEELQQFGFSAFQCLAYDLKHKKHVPVRKILSRIWLVVKIWIYIYICVAIPCWCQTGWCCCCFCCEFCYPTDKIQTAKKFFAQNPPGVLLSDQDGRKRQYKPTLFEIEAYEEMASEIRGL